MAGTTRMTFARLSCSSPIASKLIGAAMILGNPQTMAAYTTTLPDAREDNSGAFDMTWYTAQVPAAQIAAAVNALRPGGLGPMTLTHYLNGVTTTIQL